MNLRRLVVLGLLAVASVLALPGGAAARQRV
jgi:hypothetical protein